MDKHLLIIYDSNNESFNRISVPTKNSAIILLRDAYSKFIKSVEEKDDDAEIFAKIYEGGDYAYIDVKYSDGQKRNMIFKVTI